MACHADHGGRFLAHRFALGAAPRGGLLVLSREQPLVGLWGGTTMRMRWSGCSFASPR